MKTNIKPDDLDKFYGYPLTEVIQQAQQSYKAQVLADVRKPSIHRKRRSR